MKRFICLVLIFCLLLPCALADPWVCPNGHYANDSDRYCGICGEPRPVITAPQLLVESGTNYLLLSWSGMSGSDFMLFTRPSGTATWSYERTINSMPFLMTNMTEGTEIDLRLIDMSGHEAIREHVVVGQAAAEPTAAPTIMDEATSTPLAATATP